MNLPLPDWAEAIPDELPMKDIRSLVLLRFLYRHHGNRGKAAIAAGLARKTFLSGISWAKMLGYRIPKPPVKGKAGKLQEVMALTEGHKAGDCARSGKCRLPDRCYSKDGCLADKIVVGGS